MKIQRQIGNRGFTLVELMIVIVIIGVLAALATFGFMQYVKKSKTAEADEFVKKLSDGSRTYFTSEQKYGGDEGAWHTGGTAGYPVAFGDKVYPGGTGWDFKTHTDIPKGGTKALPDLLKTALEPSGDAKDKAALKKLQFNVTEPMYFQYTYTVGGKGETATAAIKAIADFDPQASANHTMSKTMSVQNGDPLSPPPVIENEFE